LFLIIQCIKVFLWRFKKVTIFKNYQILIASLLLSLISIFIFKIDWEFSGEIKDNRITEPVLFVMIVICNLLNLIIVGISNVIKKII